MFSWLIGGCLSNSLFPFIRWLQLFQFILRVLSFYQTGSRCGGKEWWLLFSPIMHWEIHILFSTTTLHLHSFPPVYPPFPILFLHAADVTLLPWRGSGVPEIKHGHSASTQLLLSSCAPPHSSTSTVMMPVKGFLPNLSALMFASVLSHETGKKGKIPK